MNNRTAATEDEQFGASLFIVGVLIWYSMGIGGMLIMQVRVRDETIEDRARRRARLFLDSLDDQTHTKQILGKSFSLSLFSLEQFSPSEELVDKNKRQRLWNIYLDKNVDLHGKDESTRIRNIEKQLALLNQNSRWAKESVESLVSISDERRVRIRRRSSFDQEILERWKTMFEQYRVHEQVPWRIQKHLIRRHFRRARK